MCVCVCVRAEGGGGGVGGGGDGGVGVPPLLNSPNQLQIDLKPCMHIMHIA